MTPIDQVLRYLGEVVLYGGGSAAVAFLLFQYLGKGWIDARFHERLEAFKHEQAKELQRLKVEVDALLSGALKIQEREFTVLPEAWQKLSDTYSTTGWAISPMQQYAAVGRMADDELDEFLSKSELLDSQKARVRTASERTRDKTFQEITSLYRLSRASTAVGELQNYIASQGLFLPPALKTQFQQLQPILWSALTKVRVGREAEDYKMQQQGWEELQQKAEPIHKAIELAISERLHSHGKPKSDA